MSSCPSLCPPSAALLRPWSRVSAALFLGLATILGTAVGVQAAVRPAALFASGMVLQRDQAVPVWGFANPGEQVTVAFAGQAISTTADAQGKWRVDLAPLALNATGSTMTITGENTVTLDDILVGDVWLCSGQSNMAFKVADARDAAQEIAAANYPEIRQFFVPLTFTTEPQDDCGGTWSVCSPATVGSYSAVAYFFGRELHSRLGIPIGLINSSNGGTPAEAWMSLAKLRSDPEFEPVFQRWVSAAGTKKWPTGLYNAMIHPLLPMALKGVIWYQGEEDAPRYQEYRKIFPALIQHWREEFEQPDLPFYFVQLANCTRSSDPTGMQWAFQREAQMQGLKLLHTGVAVTIDIGENDNIHPKNKQDVGLRLALNALAGTYGQQVEFSGPVFSGVSREGNALRVHFTHAGGLRSQSGVVSGFEVAGEDRNFTAANATIEGDTVLVSAATVSLPAYVRYAWHNTPSASLFNAANLPASPFRSGTWFRAASTVAGGPVRPLANDYVAVGDSPDPANVGLYNPSIVRLSTGRLLASYTEGGDAAGAGLPLMVIKASDDGGQTWQVKHEVFTSSLRLTQARLFEAGGVVYLMGHTGNVRIMRSTDHGETWEPPVYLTTGQEWQTTPANVWRAGGNVYIAMERRLSHDIESWYPGELSPVLWRAKETDDLTLPSKWTRSSELDFRDLVPGYRVNQPEMDDTGVPFFPQSYPTRTALAPSRNFHPMGWLETNVVQILDPNHAWYDPSGRTFHLFMRANTGGTGYAALAKVVENPDGTMTTALETSPAGGTRLFTPFPGGQMKFHLLYDQATGLYWLVSSQATDSMTRADRLPGERYNIPNEERHRLVLHFSRNMIDWCFAGVVAIGASPRQSRHYASMDIDGNDLVILSRSGDARAPNAHDGNLITFHRVKNFRDLVY